MSGESRERGERAARERPVGDQPETPAVTRTGRASRYFHYWLESSVVTQTITPGGTPRSAGSFLPEVRTDTLSRGHGEGSASTASTRRRCARRRGRRC